jgi:REP element-mobilizing transposase RayT
VPGLDNLRGSAEMRVLRSRFSKGRDRFGFRLVHFSVQKDHIHMIAEAENATSLARGLQGLAVRVARGLNKHWKRKGKVFADRYHARILRTPKEVRAAIVYVLNNTRKHSATVRAVRWYKKNWVDSGCTSADFFHGWRGRKHREPAAGDPVVAPRTWLVKTGWLQHHGAIATDEAPGRAALEAQRRALAKRTAKEAARAAATKVPPADAPAIEPDAATLRDAARKQQGRPLPHDEHYILALM